MACVEKVDQNLLISNHCKQRNTDTFKQHGSRYLLLLKLLYTLLLENDDKRKYKRSHDTLQADFYCIEVINKLTTS